MSDSRAATPADSTNRRSRVRMTSNSSSACRTSSPFDSSCHPLAAEVSQGTPRAPSHSDNGAGRLWSRSQGLLAREDLGGNVKDLGNSFWREPGVIAGDLVPRHALGEAFEHKANAEAGATNARLPAKRVGILDDPSHVGSVARVAIFFAGLAVLCAFARNAYANSLSTTLPPTSVRRKSRPWWR